MLVAYSAAMFTAAKSGELGQFWMTMLLTLLIALNDPMYIARVMLGGNHSLYLMSVMGQVLMHPPCDSHSSCLLGSTSNPQSQTHLVALR